VSAAVAINVALVHKRLYTSFDKNPPCAATGMAVLREIHFGGGGVVIGKGAHALDHVETNLGNFLCS
jgi:hypothetical protein